MSLLFLVREHKLVNNQHIRSHYSVICVNAQNTAASTQTGNTQSIIHNTSNRTRDTLNSAGLEEYQLNCGITMEHVYAN